MKEFINQFIVLDGTQENLNKVIKKAKELGYIEFSSGLEWSTSEKNILKFDEDGHYFLSINTKEELLKKGYRELPLDNYPHYVYVSNNSVEDALEIKEKRILLHDLGEMLEYRYICLAEYEEEYYLNGEKDLDTDAWRYVAQIPDEDKKITLTLQEIADKFGVDKNNLLINK